MSRAVELVEVSPRDGLQNEKQLVTTADKLEMIARAKVAGFRRIEIASFVHPKRVPQMADAEDVVAGVEKDGTTHIGLALNMRGAHRALETEIDEIGCVAVAADGFGERNQGQTSAESIAESQRIIRFVTDRGRRANVTISVAFGCPFDGEVDPAHVIDMARALADAGPHEIALGDTIGVADPWRVKDLFGRLKEALPGMPLRGHFHNTRNTGLANAAAALEAGAATLDASLGGIGGCPFAPNATGNIPTEDLLYMLERGGIDTGVDLEKAIDTARWIDTLLGGRTPGLLGKAGLFPRPAG